MAEFAVNDRSYRLPSGPMAVVCVDGCEDAYLNVALEQGRMPQLAGILAGGWRGMARGALPSFTNVNNAAIVTGQPPVVTGLSGNFFLDPDTGEEVMMNSADFLYLSLTDYIQHKFAPEEEGALEFYAALDEQLGRLADLGCRLGITADHGMNAKCHADGSPRVIYVAVSYTHLTLPTIYSV